MKAKEIEEKLQNGSKLIVVYSDCFSDWYYIDSELPNNRINIKQFNKYKDICNFKDESQDSEIKYKQYRHYYWL